MRSSIVERRRVSDAAAELDRGARAQRRRRRERAPVRVRERRQRQAEARLATSASPAPRAERREVGSSSTPAHSSSTSRSKPTGRSVSQSVSSAEGGGIARRGLDGRRRASDAGVGGVRCARRARDARRERRHEVALVGTAPVARRSLWDHHLRRVVAAASDRRARAGCRRRRPAPSPGSCRAATP